MVATDTPAYTMLRARGSSFAGTSCRVTAGARDQKPPTQMPSIARPMSMIE